jgi:hypothetical protein
MSTCDRCKQEADYILRRTVAECFGVDYVLVDSKTGQRDYCKRCMADLMQCVRDFLGQKVERKP